MNGKVSNLHVAWLLPSVFFYWQPALTALAQWFSETTVLTTRWYGQMPEHDSALNVKLVGNVKVLKLGESATGYGSEFTYVSPKVIIPLLQLKPHVVFSNSFGVWTILALLFKPLGNWRVIIAYEGSSPSVDYRNSPLRLWLRRFMVRLADAYITNSQAGQRYLTEVLYAAGERVFVQPYEVPDPNALLGNSGESELDQQPLKHPVFLFVGHLVSRKGIHLLLQACAILQKQGCENYSLLLVGDGAQRQELEAFSQAHGLSDRTHWTGRVEYGNLGTYFRKADVFILPTLEDTWGVVVQEAMVLGKPVLCSDRAGAHEMIIAGENGYVFDPYQPEELAALMHRFIDDPDLSRIMSQKTQQTISANTPEAAAEFMAQVATFAWGDRV